MFLKNSFIIVEKLFYNKQIMKKIAFLFILIAAVSCTQKDKLSYYGASIDTSEALAPVDFLSTMQENDSVNVKVKTKIIETCSMKGCWMTVELPNGEEMRVTFKDYGFFVPKDSVEGKEVIFEGVAKKTTTSVEMQRHYAQDAGKSAEEIASIIEPKEEISFVATGVAIKDVQE